MTAEPEAGSVRPFRPGGCGTEYVSTGKAQPGNVLKVSFPFFLK